MAAHDAAAAAAAPVNMLPPVDLNASAAAASGGGGGGAGSGRRAANLAGKAAGESRQPATPHTPQVSSRHWRKIRSAVVALAAFRSRRVKATDFERIGMCGEGGSGLVYLVRLKNTTMFFALKVQRKTDLEAKEKRIRRALIEKEVLVACAHPFVCNLYTAFQDSRHLYLLMDFCSGGDLKSLVRDVAKRALTEEEARFYVSEIVAALEWVHLHGYVYRDLKPENVLIHASGHIRLGDFGTAERGSTKCNDGPGGKLCPQEVEKALVKTHAAPSSDGAGGEIGSNGGQNHPSAASAAKARTPRAVAGAKPPLRGDSFGGSGSGSGSGSGGHTFSEDEADLDDYDMDGGANESGLTEKGRPNSIIVQVDPLLTAGSTSNVIAAAAAEAAEAAAEAEADAAKEALRSSSAPAAAAAAAAAAATPAVATARSADADVCADDGSDDGGGGGGMGTTVGCGCGRSRRGKDSGLHTSAAHAQPFAKGRGSVKLNVLLDSQTFIGTADFMAPEMVTGKQRQGTGMDWWALGVMLFEITLGTLPFHSELPTQSSNEIFRSIVNAELRFPRRHNLSRSAVDFIRQLLRKDPAERLGQRKGVGEIKRHPFFSSVHWALIANSTPPFVLSGPDTPGWLASVQPSASAARDDKMATWTWMATQQDAPRPGIAASSSEAQDSLDRDSRSGRSGRHREADLDKLGDELGIAAVPTDGRVAATAAAATAGAGTGGGNEHRTTATTGEDADDFDEGGVPDHAPVLHSAATTSAALAAAATKAAQRAGAGAGKGEGGGANAAAAPPRHRKDNRASFDGYDFNTLRKVGSLRMGTQKSQGGAGVPQLAAARSMGHSNKHA